MDELTMAASHKSKNCQAEQFVSLPENCRMLICVGMTLMGGCITWDAPTATEFSIMNGGGGEGGKGVSQPGRDSQMGADG